MTTHKLNTVVFSQGWIDGQLENMVSKTAEKENEDPTPHLIACELQSQWNVVSATMDELIRENAELKRKLSVVESAFK